MESLGCVNLIYQFTFQLIRYVSWNEFVYTMLSKGEVEELIVRPDLEVVTIVLHEGAVLKGKRVRASRFIYMKYFF